MTQNYEFSLEFNPDIIQNIYSLIKEDPAYLPKPYRGGMFAMNQALQSINDTRALRIGADIISHVGELFLKQFPHNRAMVIADTNTYPVAGKTVEESLMRAGIIVEAHVVWEADKIAANYHCMSRLLETLKKTQPCVTPVAVGSGTINDVVKLASHLAGRRYMSIPTAASNCRYAAYGASIRVNDIRHFFPCPGPQAILADTDIIEAAPAVLNAAGFADLMAKMIAGADWILADWMGIEQINEKAWKMSQSGFHEALMLTEETAQDTDRTQKTEKLIEGLMLTGLSTQVVKSDLPSTGTEHLLCNLWEIERKAHGKEPLSRAELLSLSLVTLTALYNLVVRSSLEELDVAACVEAWPDADTYEKQAYEALSKIGMQEAGMQLAMGNYVTREQLSIELQQLMEYWPEVADRLAQQIMPLSELRKRMTRAKLPVAPINSDAAFESFTEILACAPYISKRFTVLSLGLRTGKLGDWLNELARRARPWLRLTGEHS